MFRRLLGMVLLGGTMGGEEIYPSCWNRLRSCRLDTYHDCKGDGYLRHLQSVGCPPQIKEALIPPNTRLLLYGTSYMRQIFKEIACLHHAARLIIDIDYKPQFSMHRFMTIYLKNNASITSVSNLQEYQRSTHLIELINFIQSYNFSQALFMESHPDCFFDGKMCVPIGNTSAVASRAATFSEVLQQCQLRSIFSTFFPLGSWLHVRPWSGLYSPTERSTQNLDACQTPLFFSAARKLQHSTSPHLLSQSKHQNNIPSIDTRSILHKKPCLVPYCHPDIGGHQCSSGAITFSALAILKRLFSSPSTPSNHAASSTNATSFTLKHLPPDTKKKEFTDSFHKENLHIVRKIMGKN